MKYTGRAEGYTVVENEITVAAKALLEAIAHAGRGSLLDAERELLLLADDSPIDHDLLVAIAGEVAYRYEQSRQALRAATDPNTGPFR